MSILLTAYGKLSELDIPAALDNMGDITVGEFRNRIYRMYPELMNGKFMIAVNNKICNDSELIRANDRVALMPPFSGG